MNDHLEEELLHRYFDGELRPARAATVMQHLERCPQCSERHRALAALRGMIDLAADESSRNVDFEALYGRIERGIREQRAPGLLERLGVWWRDLSEQRPGQVWVPAAALVAAAVVVVVWTKSTAPVAPAPQVRAPSGALPSPFDPGTMPPKPPPTALAAAGNSEIVQVDFGGNAGTVFEIALADGVSTPVVWINDDVQQ